MCLDNTNTNITLANRLRIATIWVRRLCRLPITQAQRLHTVRSMIIPAALYGSEVGHCPKAEMRTLQSAIVDAIGPGSTRRSQALVFEMWSTQGEIDPQTGLLSRKICLLTRMLGKYPQAKTKAMTLICAYATQHRKGTETWQGLAGEDGHTHNFGPISHLLVDLHRVRATLDHHFTIRQENEVPLTLIHTPWQHIRPHAIAMGQRTRYSNTHTQRTHTHTRYYSN